MKTTTNRADTQGLTEGRVVLRTRAGAGSRERVRHTRVERTGQRAVAVVLLAAILTFSGVAQHAPAHLGSASARVHWDYFLPLSEAEEAFWGFAALTTCGYLGWYFGPTGWVASSACGATALV